MRRVSLSLVVGFAAAFFLTALAAGFFLATAFFFPAVFFLEATFFFVEAVFFAAGFLTDEDFVFVFVFGESEHDRISLRYEGCGISF